MKKIALIASFCLCLLSTFARADIPVEDALVAGESTTTPVSVTSDQFETTTAEPASMERPGRPASSQQMVFTGNEANQDTRVLTPEQRMAKLEGQMSSLLQMDIYAKLTTMQQQIQTMSGQIQEQQHIIDQLKQQQLAFYNDLNSRLSKTASSEPAAKMEAGAATATKTNAQASLSEQNAYSSAYAFVTNGQYPQAIKAMQSFLAKYPNGAYASNAHYWLGELYLLQQKMPESRQQFYMVIEKYPESDKVADAMLKVGFMYADEHKYKEATQLFKSIVKKYPNTTPARLATARLKEIKQQTPTTPAVPEME